MLPGRFNIRVYGIWLHEGRVLINEELIRGQKVIKFPGGGLELGEGTIDGLKREWKEELGIDIQVIKHFYTTDFFQQSAFDDSQVISIYYLIQGDNPNAAMTNHVDGEKTYWINCRELSPETFTLPIDKIVGEMLTASF
jgi:8-oxo-dGTP diphosphatase